MANKAYTLCRTFTLLFCFLQSVEGIRSRLATQAGQNVYCDDRLRCGAQEESGNSHQIVREKVLYSRWRTLTSRLIRFPDGREVDFDVRLYSRFEQCSMHPFCLLSVDYSSNHVILTTVFSNAL